MKVISCRFFIHGDVGSVETGTMAEIELESPVNVETLKKSIPFEGIFHLRQQINFEGSNVWLDLSNDKMELSPSLQKNKMYLDIQALPLSFGNNELGALHPEWEDNCESVGGSSPGHIVNVLESAENFADKVDATAIAATRKIEEVMSSEAVQKIGQKSIAVGKSITKLWSTGVAKVGNIKSNMEHRVPQAAVVPPSEALTVLRSLSTDFTTKITPTPENKDLLKKLGSFINPASPTSPQWKRGGFISESPVNEFAKTGVLGLKSLVYFTERYTHKATTMMEAQRPCTSSHYPFAIVGINLTMMLADVLSLKERKFETREGVFWMVFEHDLEEEAFFEIFSIAMMHIDHLWVTRKATRKEFGEIIKSTKSSLIEVLEKGPSSLSDLLLLSTKSGLVH
mmetsp:Transcript_47291/g.60761  ORF Transcript_47291/g.60761 Transcript_47291/m.60761 type:complete len:397 (+) Transcript_47291:89-1279(+)